MRRLSCRLPDRRAPTGAAANGVRYWEPANAPPAASLVRTIRSWRRRPCWLLLGRAQGPGWCGFETKPASDRRYNRRGGRRRCAGAALDAFNSVTCARRTRLRQPVGCRAPDRQVSLHHGRATVDFEYYAWRLQLLLSILFAVSVARVAGRKGRHPVAAALLMLLFANGWPVVWSAVGRGIGLAFRVNEDARVTMERAFSFGGLMFGAAVTYAIVGCWKSREPMPR